MSQVVHIADVHRRRAAIALRLVVPPPQKQTWRYMGLGWAMRPGPDGDAWIRHGLRERVFEAVRLGRLTTDLHCRACGRPLQRGEVAYREVDPPAEEPVSWREVRICGRCVDGKENGDG
jgi:hypothetical protein